MLSLTQAANGVEARLGLSLALTRVMLGLGWLGAFRPYWENRVWPGSSFLEARISLIRCFLNLPQGSDDQN